MNVRPRIAQGPRRELERAMVVRPGPVAPGDHNEELAEAGSCETDARRRQFRLEAGRVWPLKPAAYTAPPVPPRRSRLSA